MILALLVFKIAFRNLFRQKRRTFLTLLILVSGSTGLILIGGFFDNIMRGLREQFIHSQSGHLQIGAPGYFRLGNTAPFVYLMSDAGDIQRELSLHPAVKAVLPRLRFMGMVSSSQASIPIEILGVDPVKERQMGNFQYRDALHPSVHIAEGEDLSPDSPYDILVGKSLLDALQVRVGDSIHLLTMHAGGTMDGGQFRIRGTFETIVKESDERTVKINLASAQRLFGLKDEIHTLAVLADRTEDVPALGQDLERRLQRQKLPHSMITWQELGAMCVQSEAIFDKVRATIQLIMSVIVIFSVANTINMSLMERTREFGTMMAIGNSRAFILATLISEAVLLGLIGSVLGIAIGTGTAEIVSRAGIEMPPPPTGTHGYYAMIEVSPRLLLGAAQIIFASSVVASLLPSVRLAKMKIVHAMGYA